MPILWYALRANKGYQIQIYSNIFVASKPSVLKFALRDIFYVGSTSNPKASGKALSK